jgi:hypothetical protein
MLAALGIQRHYHGRYEAIVETCQRVAPSQNTGGERITPVIMWGHWEENMCCDVRSSGATNALDVRSVSDSNGNGPRARALVRGGQGGNDQRNAQANRSNTRSPVPAVDIDSE